MKNKLKKVYLSALLTLPISVFSCANYSNQATLNSIISNVDSVTSPSSDNKKKSHETIINTILSNAFRSDRTKIVEYTKTQTENYEKLMNEFKLISEGFFKSQNKKEFAISQQEFFKKNWYFILNNLDKFQFNFIEFVTSDLSKNYSTSEEYQQKMRIKESNNKYNPFEFENTYLENIREGAESAELGDALVYYIRKNKMIFRILINNLRAEGANPEVFLRPINWNFGESTANTISPLLVSNVVHQLFIHNYPKGREEFENEMVKKQKYGSPSFVFPTVK
ncbi:hypothetical protein MCANUFG1_01971 [Mycoplasmopsis canis UFG1]|uniref:aromatic motif membrane protein n=1 Tax=Mycoplasmopsis canis TaxID=29555 RepID=UPI00025B0017|nr:aromatic motif membrane protein [Mycoplasmopsis canis]EIE41602.1 hypothetical protein MCANUFG1_01971 [Mycoplasmopsis canis UFG1]